MTASRVRQTEERILRVVADKGRQLVSAYYGSPLFAGDLFDTFGDNNPVEFTASDVVAASLLDVRFGPDAVRSLLKRGSANQALVLLPNFIVPIWDASADLGKASPAWALWTHLLQVRGVGETRASKLMARKRPHLFPILDSVVRTSLGLEGLDGWAVLQEVLSGMHIRAAIDSMAPNDIAVARPSTLRLLDVATWMRFSKSRNARAVQQALGLDPVYRILPTSATVRHPARGHPEFVVGARGPVHGVLPEPKAGRVRSSQAGWLAPVEFRVASEADEPRADVIHFIDDGKSSHLELVSYSDSSPSSWPSDDRLTVIGP